MPNPPDPGAGPPPPPPPPPPAPRQDAAPDEEFFAPPALSTGALTMAEVEVSEEESLEPEDRFRTWVAIAIAVASILGAVVAFSATLTQQDAVRLSAQGIQDASRQQQIITNLQATVNEDLRYLAPYQEHLKAAAALDQQATGLEASDPTSAALLHAEAESERVLARSWQGFFQAALPDPGTATGPVQYDAAAALQRLEANDQDLQGLQPSAVIAEADAKHSESVTLVGLVTLFVASLLFLTLAQFSRRSIRRIFAAAGGLVALIGLALWLITLRTGS